MTFLIALLLCQAPPDTKVYPAPGKYCGVVRVSTVSKWSVLGIAVVNGAPVLVPVKSEILDGGKTCLIEAGPGSYAVTQWPEGAAQPETHVLALGPQTPIPPGPGPNPPGPGPTPDPTPAPIPSAGLRVLILYETSELSKLPISQASILSSTALRRYLDEKCVRAGQTPEYRIYDKDTDLSKESELWRAAAKRPFTTLPFLVVSNGKTGWEGPLPTSLEETMAIIKRHEQ